MQSMVASKPFQTELLTFYFIEKQFSKLLVISYATRTTVICVAVIGDIDAEICNCQNLLVYQATAAGIRQPRAKVNDLSFPGLDENIGSYEHTNLESLLSRPVETELGFASRQQETPVMKLENNTASPQDSQSVMDVSVVGDKEFKKTFVAKA